MPYIGGGNFDKKLHELRERQASRRTEVAAANKREEVKLSAFLNKLDSKHDRDMINISTKLHVTKVDLVREIQKDTSPKLLQLVQKGSKHLKSPQSSKVASNLQSKSAKLDAVKVPSKLPSHGDNDKVAMPRVYPFHLIKPQHMQIGGADGRKKKQLQPISPRQFPILAAKYYRESQIGSEKIQKSSNVKLSSPNEVIESILNGGKSESCTISKSKQNYVHLQKNSLPPVSIHSTLPSYPPPNSPQIRRNVNEISMHSTNTTNDPSDEDLQMLRNGQYFLRYSSTFDDETAEELKQITAHDDQRPSEVSTEEKSSAQSLRAKSRLDEALTVVEDCNKPRKI